MTPRPRRQPRTDRELRERAIALLKQTRHFRNTSVRLVADLVDKYGIKRVGPDGLSGLDPALIAILDEPVDLCFPAGEPSATAPAPAAVESALAGISGESAGVAAPGGAAAATAAPSGTAAVLVLPLDVGVHLRDHGLLAQDVNWRESSLRLNGHAGAHVFVVPTTEFASRLPRSLVNALDLRQPGDPVSRAPEPLLIWMAHDPSRAAPLELLARLLAETVAQDLPSVPIAVVTLSRAGGMRIERWDGACFRPANVARPQVPIEAHELRALVGADEGGERGRIFVVHLDDPLHLPPADNVDYGFDAETKFDQAVLVTDHVPEVVRDELHALLDPSTLFMPSKDPAPSKRRKRREVGFNAVLPAVLIEPAPPGFRWSRWLGADPPVFGTHDEPDDHRLSASTRDGDKARLFRDACHLTLDLRALQKAWLGRDRNRTFIDQIDDEVRARIRRWGRAVTNRRVGIAVSGGGACAYRLAGLIQRLEDAEVPVDVVAGLSGGALIGAYYCALGREGLDRAIAHAPIFGALLPLALVSSWFIEKAIDWDLGCARIGETDVRYVAVTTELAHGKAPCARIVTGGSVGEAVRVSGTLPPLFGPTDKGKSRYTDGGASTLVPAEIVRCCGADLTVAYNVIGGPSDGDPLAGLPRGIGSVLRRLPLLERLIDTGIWTLFLWSRASREFGQCADVSIAFCEDFSAVEAVSWFGAEGIAGQAYRDQQVIDGTAEVASRWRRLQTRGW